MAQMQFSVVLSRQADSAGVGWMKPSPIRLCVFFTGYIRNGISFGCANASRRITRSEYVLATIDLLFLGQQA